MTEDGQRVPAGEGSAAPASAAPPWAEAAIPVQPTADPAIGEQAATAAPETRSVPASTPDAPAAEPAPAVEPASVFGLAPEPEPPTL